MCNKAVKSVGSSLLALTCMIRLVYDFRLNNNLRPPYPLFISSLTVSIHGTRIVIFQLCLMKVLSQPL